MTSRRPFAVSYLLGLLLALAGCGIAPTVNSKGPADGAEVTTDRGIVRGTVTPDHRRFQGIPFAAPPVGELRWAPPRPAAPWDGVREALTPGARCAQVPAFGDSEGSTAEDCLYLDVTTPAGRSATARPVMVWLHGGSFTEGAGSDADARRLAVDGDVIVVTINYRLGIFGLFGLADLPGSGTFALQDQLAALTWVRSNITAFGGDPGKITVFGESAGAKSICALLTSPPAADLFQRAIMQSGPCTGTVPAGMLFPGLPEFDQWMPLPEREAMGAATAERLGCKASELDCLRALPAEALLAHHHEFITPAFGGDVLPRHPSDLITSGEFHRVPILSGTTRDELTYSVAAFHDGAGRPITATAFRSLLATALGDRAATIAARYPLTSFQSPSHAWAAVTTDRVFTCPAVARHRALSEHVPTFVYEYAEPEPRSAYPGLTFDPGAVHAGELPLLFADFDDPDALPVRQRALSETMINSWSTFARNGDPNVPGGAAWPAHTSTDRSSALSLSSDGLAPVDLATEHRCDEWFEVDPKTR